MNNDDPSLNVVVQNEFERVLTNPGNVIMSEQLRAMLPVYETEDIQPGSVTLISNATAKESREYTCSFRSLTSSADGFRIELEFADVNSFMEHLVGLAPGFVLKLARDLDISLESCSLESWDVFKDMDTFIVGLGVKGEIQF